MILINTSILGEVLQISNLVEMGIIEVLVYSLEMPENFKFLENLIDGLDNIFYWGEIIKENVDLTQNPFVKNFEEIGGLKKILEIEEKIESDDFFNKIENLIMKYFNEKKLLNN